MQIGGDRRPRTTCSHLLHRCCRLRGAQKHENTRQTTHLGLYNINQICGRPLLGPTITHTHTDHHRVSTTWYHSWATTTHRPHPGQYNYNRPPPGLYNVAPLLGYHNTATHAVWPHLSTTTRKGRQLTRPEQPDYTPTRRYHSIMFIHDSIARRGGLQPLPCAVVYFYRAPGPSRAHCRLLHTPFREPIPLWSVP